MKNETLVNNRTQNEQLFRAELESANQVIQKLQAMNSDDKQVAFVLTEYMKVQAEFFEALELEDSMWVEKWQLLWEDWQVLTKDLSEVEKTILKQKEQQ
ncbi:MAG: hypothetical protein R3A13_06680 [Bdellovibrionota bacterium]